MFAQPWGALGLLAVPVVLLVHLLRQRPTPVVVTTLFLLDVVQPQQQGGRRIETVSRWWLLLVRLLGVVLATWLLMQPRWSRSDEVLRVAVVLDASASMSAVQAEVQAGLQNALGALITEPHLDLSVYSSAASRILLARGDRAALAAGLDAWAPNLGTHDVKVAFDLARRGVGPEGVVVFVTDHPVAVPDGVLLLSMGRAQDNVGITGLKVETEGTEVVWSAAVHSFAAQPAVRSFVVYAGDAPGPKTELSLEPGQTRWLKGRFPDGAEHVRLSLSPDALSTDDELWVVRPQPKVLRVYVDPQAESLALVQRLMVASPGIVRVTEAEAADLQLVASAEPRAPRPGVAQIAFVLDPQLEVRQPATGVVAESHALTDALPWHGLVFRRPPPTKLPEPAQGLLWKGALPLVYLGRADWMVVRLDPRGSNAERNPGFILMLARFVEDTRRGLPVPEARNVELGQALSLAVAPSAEPLQMVQDGLPRQIPQAEWGSLRAPQRPGLFSVTQGERRLLLGAARFADLRELDLRGASAQALSTTAVQTIAQQRTQPDPLRPLWALLILALTLGSYGLAARVRA